MLDIDIDPRPILVKWIVETGLHNRTSKSAFEYRRVASADSLDVGARAGVG